MNNPGSNKLHQGATFSLACLILLCLAWEAFVASTTVSAIIFALKVLPLVLAFKGVLQGRIYTLQWASMLVLLYFMEGVVRATSDSSPASRIFAGTEIILSLSFYFCAIFYVRPYKKLAKLAKREEEAQRKLELQNKLRTNSSDKERD